MVLYVIVALVVIGILVNFWFLLIPVAVFWAVWEIYAALYFNGKSFCAIKDRVKTYIADCNELAEHIESLKSTDSIDNRLNQGVASYSDKSKWNFQRKELAKRKNLPNMCECSRTVCNSAKNKPFEYLCKYFNIKADAETLNKFEEILNNFETVEEGKKSLVAEKEEILTSIQGEVPVLIRKFKRTKLEKQLGFEDFDFKTEYFPMYIFRYTSSGGNASTQCEIIMDIDNLNKFVAFLSEKIKFKKSIAGQRALMTSKLRQKIKERDHFECKKCHVSISQEPHLLLEIDHIIPVSKGGLTTEDNLQTLCWRCNRSKGAKI